MSTPRYPHPRPDTRTEKSMTRHGQRLAAALATVGALLIVGCRDTSDDDSSSNASVAPATSQPSEESAPAETNAPETTGASESSTAETTADTATSDTATPESEGPPAEAWTVNVDDCPDPDAATAPIEGELKIGSAQPLSGPVAGGFSPVA